MSVTRTEGPLHIVVRPEQWWARPLVWLRLRKSNMQRVQDAMPDVIDHPVNVMLAGPGTFKLPPGGSFLGGKAKLIGARVSVAPARVIVI